MKTFSLITILLLSIASVQIAQAENLTTYNVSVTFSDTTTFSGNLTYDSTANRVTSLTGTLFDNAMENQVGLTYLLSSVSDGKGGLLATAYTLNSTTVFASGSNSKTAGNNNAFVTIDFNPTNPKASDINLSSYADCTPGGLMMKGTVSTTGKAGGGTMGGAPTNETITMAYSVSVGFSDTTAFSGKFTYDFTKNQVTSLSGTLYDNAMGGNPVSLTYLLPSPSSQSDGSGGIMANAYALNSTTVFASGSNEMTAGNNNAFVTIDVNATNPSLGATNINLLAYADCTPGGLMMRTMCTTGLAGGGTMGGAPTNETIKTAPSPGLYLNDSLVTISLGPNAGVGQNADWWLVAQTPWGRWYSYVYPNKWVDIGTDLGHVTPAYQGPLTNISSLALFDITGLAGGNYYLYFGVDMNKNGVLDYGQLYYSKFMLNIP
jgi:hypothetical protein